MKLSHLRTFVVVADSGGLSRAADRLNLTQSAASRQITALELELGVALFERSGRRNRLTSEGDELVWRSRRLLAEADSLGERARALKGGQAGSLRVSATPQVIQNLLAPFLSHYLQRHPSIDVQFTESGGARQRSQLERGEVHLALMASGAEGLCARPLYPIHVMAFFPVSHRLSRRAILNITELADQPLLLLNHDYGSRSWFDAACNIADISPRILLESGSPLTLMALAEVGYGIAVLPSNIHAPQGAVRAVALIDRGQSVGKWSVIAWNPQRTLAPYATRFVEEIATHVRHGYPGRALMRRAPAIPRPKEVVV